MTETKTVELPLTRSEQRHLDNKRRREEKRRRASARDGSREQRDAKLAAINAEYGPKIRELEDKRKAALAKVWADWKAEEHGVTDAELWKAVQAELEQTTISGKKWVAQGRTPGHWANAYALGAQIGQAPPPPPSDEPAQPTLAPGYLTFVARNGVINFFDAGGKDCVLRMDVGVASVEQLKASQANGNAVITVKNAGKLIVDDVATDAQNLQGPGIGNGYGYGLYLINIDQVWGKYSASGPGMAQAVFLWNVRMAQFLEGQLDAMHPVWHVAKGSPAEVHTDVIQSNGGPAILELYKVSSRTCGSFLQVQPGAAFPMGMWRFHDVTVTQTTNPLSDEGAYLFDKTYANGKTWPTENLRCTYHSVPGWTTFGVGWGPNDPAAYNPGGPWQNTGEAWTSV